MICCANCGKRIFRARNDDWYHSHNASVSCRPGEGSENRADPMEVASTRPGRCPVDWGSATPSQRCARASGHHGVHIDGKGREFDYVPDLSDPWGSS